MRVAMKPTHLIVVWDGGLDKARVGMLPEYKAQRPEMPDDLKSQLDGLTAYLQAAGIASFCADGVEADDYIAWLAKSAAGAGADVVIASADKDFMQLVSPRVGLLNPNDKSGEVWTAAQVAAKTGVKPEQIVGWLSLMGDAVDNIPGVPGVGPKTATALLNEFGSVQALFEKIDAVKPERLRAALRGSKEIVLRNLELIRLRDDFSERFELEKLSAKPADVSGLRGLFQRWGFKGLLAALPEPAQIQQPVLI